MPVSVHLPDPDDSPEGPVSAGDAAGGVVAYREAYDRALLENGHDVIQVLDASGRILFTSGTVTRMLGYDPDTLVGRTAEHLVHPEDLPMIASFVRDVLATPGTPRSAEYRVRHQDGSWRWMESFFRTVSPDSAAHGLVAHGRDVTDRRQAEEALRAAEERWRRMIENAHDIMVILAADGTILYQSPSVTRVLGYQLDEQLGAVAFSFMHPDDVARVATAMAGVIEVPGSVGYAEYRYRHKDGGWRYLEAFGRTLAPNSAADGIVANVRDVTERKAAEQALKDREELFRRLTENGSDLLMVCEPEGSITYASASVERLLGYTPEAMLGKLPIDLLHPDDVPPVLSVLAAMREDPERQVRLTWRIRHADGSWRHFEALGRLLDPKRIEQGFITNARDVTEQRAAEAALQESEAKYRSLVESAQDMITAIGTDGTIRFQSAAVERILGFTAEAMIGRNVFDFIHPSDVAATRAVLQQVVEHPGTVATTRYRARRRDGGWRVLEASGRTVLPDSASAGTVGILRDVTTQVQTEEALRQATADAERANRAKSEFLSRMSHELRTPLNSILGFAQVLEDVELPPAYRAGVQHILNGGRHLLRLINEVLDIARIEADEQPLLLGPVQLSAVIAEAVDMVRPLAAARGIVVGQIGAPAGTGWVYADRQRLTQVLLNLLSNAVKYNREAGVVRVSVRQTDGHGDARLRILVEDEGAGISEEHREQLFMPFARLGAEQTEVEGTGLGLALSQRLTRAMGGALVLERTSGHGSVFSIELPSAPDPATAPHETPGFAADGTVGTVADARILHVEDNLANRTLVETILLARPRWQLIPTAQGHLAVSMAIQQLPDLVLLDLHLPDMSGAEVLKQLRANESTAHIPVVIISADATPHMVEELLSDGADAYLTKPIEVRTFLQTLERLLRHRSSSR